MKCSKWRVTHKMFVDPSGSKTMAKVITLLIVDKNEIPNLPSIIPIPVF